MKTNILFLVLLFVFPVIISSANWELVWSDEFNGPSIDSDKWKWMTDCNGGGNAERQCYSDSKENSYIEDGSLVIKPIFGPVCSEGKCQDSTSARLTTSKKFTWTMGKFEWRAKLPKGDYLWPALWLFIDYPRPRGIPLYGEIDVLEAGGDDPTTIDQTVWWNSDADWNLESKEKLFRDSSFNSQSDYHTYTLEWLSDSMTFMIDDRVTFKADLTSLPAFPGMNGANVFQPGGPGFSIIMNVAVGGNFFGKNNVPDAETLQRLSSGWTEMRVDYVRVYQQPGSGSQFYTHPDSSLPGSHQRPGPKETEHVDDSQELSKQNSPTSAPTSSAPSDSSTPSDSSDSSDSSAPSDSSSASSGATSDGLRSVTITLTTELKHFDEQQFRIKMAKIFGIDPSQLIILHLASGSTIVDFSINTGNQTMDHTVLSRIASTTPRDPAYEQFQLPVKSVSEVRIYMPHREHNETYLTVAIVFGVVGVVLAIVALVAIVLVVVLRRRSHQLVIPMTTSTESQSKTATVDKV